MTDFGTLLQQAGWSVPDAAKILGYSEGALLHNSDHGRFTL